MRPRAMLGLLPADLRRLARDELLVWMPAEYWRTKPVSAAG